MSSRGFPSHIGMKKTSTVAAETLFVTATVAHCLTSILNIPFHWWWVVILAVIAFFLSTGIWRFFYLFYMTIGRDLRGYRMLKLLKRGVDRVKKENLTMPLLFKEWAVKCPSKICLICEERKWTFKEMDEYSSRVANVFWQEGFRPGDTVSLLMGSCPEYVGIFLGLSKIGVVTSLINWHLRQQSLVHSINCTRSKAMIIGSSLSQGVKEIISELPGDLQCYQTAAPVEDDCVMASQSKDWKNLDELLEGSSVLDPPRVNRNANDHMLYLFTSGTTGLPKAAIITHFRLFYGTYSTYQGMRMVPDDIVYNPLPIYHISSISVGLSKMFATGNTVVIKKKFSASRFWEDCIKHNCTVAVYIGEICRYLLAQPQKPTDHTHSVRMIIGNGIRALIWEEFVKRFGVSRIIEFYGSTESNCNLINLDSHVGAVGFVSRIAPWVYPVCLVKVDEVTGEPERNANGMCVKCKPGETGQLVGKIVKDIPERMFDGYLDRSATEKKITHNVFNKGDSAFLTGDTMVMDQFGYIYFKDRLGDTFRWKGENVSTMEVEAIMSNILQLKDCIVYGVKVPGFEGRAGMAAILDNERNVNLTKLAEDMQKALPSYARPRFIRVTDQTTAITGTFKFTKVALQNEAFDPSKCTGSKLYFLNGNDYQILDDQVFMDICDGKVSLVEAFLYNNFRCLWGSFLPTLLHEGDLARAWRALRSNCVHISAPDDQKTVDLPGICYQWKVEGSIMIGAMDEVRLHEGDIGCEVELSQTHHEGDIGSNLKYTNCWPTSGLQTMH